MNELELRQEICRVGRSLFERGYVHSTAGNISVRLPDGFLITPTEACLGFLKPEALAKVGADGVQVSGDRASKTLALHRRIYAADANAGCVIHTHSTHLVALTLAGVWKREDILPPLTPYYVMKVGHVPLIEYHRPGDPAVGDLVAQAIERMRAQGTPIRAVMLDRLGPNVWHSTPASAMAALEELEETARLWLVAVVNRSRSHLNRSSNYASILALPGRSAAMLRFAANLSFMYGEYAFPDRFAAAARDGFTAVEYLFPYEYPAQQLAAWLQSHGLVQVLFNAPPGNWAAGERGLASLPGRETSFAPLCTRPLNMRKHSIARGCT